MKWYDSFVTSCLDGLPKDKYRKRAQAELTDHLLTLTDELAASGYSPEEAQIRAVELMGDPGELNEGFRAEWVQKAEQFSYCAPLLVSTVFVGLLLGSLLTWFILIPGTYFFPWLFTADHLYAIFYALHLVPAYWMGAKELDRAFALHPHKPRFVVFGLVLAWSIEIPLTFAGFFLFQLIPLSVQHLPVISVLYLLLSYVAFLLFPATCTMLISELSGFYVALTFVICVAVILRYSKSTRQKTKTRPIPPV